MVDHSVARQQRAKLSAKAIQYSLKRWPALTRFLDDGCLCMSNNAAVRCIAVGRKNWTFAESDEGGRRAAAIYGYCGPSGIRSRMEIPSPRWRDKQLEHAAPFTARRGCLSFFVFMGRSAPQGCVLCRQSGAEVVPGAVGVTTPEDHAALGKGLLPEATRNPTSSMCSADDSAGMRQKKTPP